VGGSDDDPVITFFGDGLAQGVSVGAAAFDPGVDGDAEQAGALLNGFLKSERGGALLRERSLEGECERHAREEGRDQRGMLGGGQAQRAIKRVGARRLGDEREQDPLV